MKRGTGGQEDRDRREERERGQEGGDREEGEGGAAREEGRKQRAKGQGSEDKHGSRQTTERWR